MEALKRVVLFGRTGDGKSTVANVLITGNIDEVVFKFSDSASGCTREIKTETKRGWQVTDTLGVGEAAHVGAVSHERAKQELEEFLQHFGHSYSHIIYVMKAARRITELDEVIWLLFKKIFEGAEKAFVVLMTHASDDWLSKNRDNLPEDMKQYHILTTDIPPVGNRSKRVNYELLQDRKRQRSMGRLEADLMRVFAMNNFEYATPDIATMSQEQRKEKVESIWRMIVNKIRSMFPEPDWEMIAHQISSIVNVAKAFARGDSVRHKRDPERDVSPDVRGGYAHIS